jgi:hypothetical protein
MGVTTRRTGSLPTEAWDDEASADLGAALRAAMVQRAFVRGEDTSDKPFVAYDAGYAADLREAGEPTRVDLTRTGRLRAGVERSVARVDEDGVTLSLPADVRGQASGVQARRQFWGISPRDAAELAEALPRVAAEALERGKGRKR